jgi:hypothetical protein
MKIKLKNFILPFFIFTLFSFKLNLISGVGNSNGVRIDDFLILIMWALLSPKIMKKIELFSSDCIVYFLIFIALNILSSLLNLALGSEVNVITSLLFSLRPLEYLIFFPVGYYLGSCQQEIKKLFLTYSIFIFLLSILQRAGIVGGVTLFTTTTRASANLGGPWELAVVASFLMFWFLKSDFKRKLLLSLMPCMALILSESRITIIGTLLIVAFDYVRSDNFISRKASIVFVSKTILVCVTIGVIAVFAFSLSDSFPLFSRLSNFANAETFSNLSNSFNENFNPSFQIKSQSDYLFYGYGDVLDSLDDASGAGDASAFIRFHRWSLLLNAYKNGNVLNWLFGLSPAYAGLAVDGNYLRILIESGICGLVVFMIWIVRLLKTARIISSVLIYSLFSLMISALFIDVFVAYKPMMLIWFFYGYYLFQKEKKDFSGVNNDGNFSLKIQ